jgi:thiamine kinase-like enzyme
VSGRATIIDWGSARLAPAMLDIAGIAAHGSPSEGRYLGPRERLDGRPADPAMVVLGYHWAEVQIATQNLHYVAEFASDGELSAMLERRARALVDLERCLDRAP